ncbi:MAG: methylenetetrahydrofolate reductase C-terminal domain-containing protein [Candidatus Riflebacteria bacterium]|nr:methylenetetrahydrofolate reductase C-terminal domain-containing protein [Candidatus Riflebacteria bacterium]
MIKTIAVGFDEIKSKLEPDESLGIIGCGDCAAALGTGGTKQVENLMNFLSPEFPVLFSTVFRSPCDQRVLYRFIDLLPNFENVSKIIMLACPAGIQSLNSLLRERNSFTKVISGLKPIGLNWLSKNKTDFNACKFCTICEFDGSTTFCPVAACPLNRFDGPCQNRNYDDTCPIEPEKTCIWLEIFSGRSEK